MILTCPSCSASYNVPAEAIGLNGRTVRCKKCKHEWFQDGEKKAIDDLINLIQNSEIEVDDIAFDDGKKKAKPSIQKEKASLKQKVAVLQSKLKNLVPAKLKNALFTGDNRGFLSHFASFMVALAVFSCLFFILVSSRWAISSVLPSIAPIYEAAGFPLHNYASLNPEESLIIDRISLQLEGDKREILGNLINVTSQNIRVPHFKLDYLDIEGKLVHVSKAQLPIPLIQKEAAFPFNISIADDVPKEFSSVKISFTD